jgi:hypothetical protein
MFTVVRREDEQKNGEKYIKYMYEIYKQVCSEVSMGQDISSLDVNNGGQMVSHAKNNKKCELPIYIYI